MRHPLIRIQKMEKKCIFKILYVQCMQYTVKRDKSDDNDNDFLQH